MWLYTVHLCLTHYYVYVHLSLNRLKTHFKLENTAKSVIGSSYDEYNDVQFYQNLLTKVFFPVFLKAEEAKLI